MTTQGLYGGATSRQGVNLYKGCPDVKQWLTNEAPEQTEESNAAVWLLKHYPTQYHHFYSPDDHPNPQLCLRTVHEVWEHLSDSATDDNGYLPFIWWPTVKNFSHRYLDSPYGGYPVMRAA